MKRRTIALVVGSLLVCATFASASASPPKRIRTIVLTIHHSRFSVHEFRAHRGETVKLVVRNTDPIDHELIVGPMEVQLRHEVGKRRWHPPIPGEVSVKLFSTASTTYTFDEKGPVLFGCHLPRHWAYGMQGTISVT